MLFGVSADDYKTENRLKTAILGYCTTDDITVLVLNKHSQASTNIYSGYAYVIAETEQSGYISTTAATMPAMTTVDYYDSTTNDVSIFTTENFKMRFSTAGVLSEEEYVNLAQTLGITDAKLQIVLQVFLYYSQFVQESDLELLAEMNLSDLVNLYNNTINP